MSNVFVVEMDIHTAEPMPDIVAVHGPFKDFNEGNTFAYGLAWKFHDRMLMDAETEEEQPSAPEECKATFLVTSSNGTRYFAARRAI